MFKGVIARLLAKETGLLEGEIDSLLETPPSPELGDFAFPCFILAKSMKKLRTSLLKSLLRSLSLRLLSQRSKLLVLILISLLTRASYQQMLSRTFLTAVLAMAAGL